MDQPPATSERISFREVFRSWFRDFQTETYCVPPVYFNRVPYRVVYFAGKGFYALCQPGEAPSRQPDQSDGTCQLGQARSSQPDQSDGTCQLDQARSSQPDQSDGTCQLDQARNSQPDQSVSAVQPLRSRASTFQSGTGSAADKSDGSVFPGPASQSESSGRARDQSLQSGSSQPGGDGGPSQTDQSGGCAQSAQPAESSQPSPDLFPIHVQENDVRDDFAQWHILTAFSKFGEDQKSPAKPMFIISNLRFKDILVRSTAPVRSEGEFDIILLIKKAGICIGEIKSVGINASVLKQSESKLLEKIAAKVKDGVGQLTKQRTVMKKHVARGCPIRATLMLPYVRRTQLEQVLTRDHHLAQNLCKCLGALHIEQAVMLCVCQDDVSRRVDDQWSVAPDAVSKLNDWFRRRFKQRHAMLNGTYEDLAFKLSGPHTAIYVHSTTSPRLEVRILPEAVSETGERVAQIVLSPEQVKLLNEAPKLAWITGPPGTGKTVTAVVQGLRWLTQGHDVHVLVCAAGSWCAAHMIHDQLESMLCATTRGDTGAGKVGRPYLHCYDFYKGGEAEIERALRELKELEGPAGELHLVVDECDHGRRDQTLLPQHRRFFRELIRSVPHLNLWAISMYNDTLHDDQLARPDDELRQMKPFKMTLMLRCPPSVQRHVQQGIEGVRVFDQYSVSTFSAPCAGPDATYLSHERHSATDPAACRLCGMAVARKIRELMRGPTNAGLEGPDPLRYRDFMVLTCSSQLHQGRSDTAAHSGPSARGACGFLAGLRSEEIPYTVLQTAFNVQAGSVVEQTVKAVARACEDKVVVSNPEWVGGLERKVLVVLPGKDTNFPEFSARDWDNVLRREAASRCTALLIIVRCQNHTWQ